MQVIQTQNLTKCYRVPFFSNEYAKASWAPAVSDLTLDVGEGEVFGFLGPNGAGKTTTIHLLLNLIRPTSGSASLFGSAVTHCGVHRRLGYLPESVNVPDYYKGADLLGFYAALAGMKGSARVARVRELLGALGLEDAADKPVAKYSKGMLQRIGLAQAVLHDPELLILDEPNSNLDPVGRKDFREFLLTLKRKGKTIFISSHILSEVESVCDRVAILQKGQLKRVGTLEELSQPTSVCIVVRSLPASVLESVTKTAATVTMVSGETRIYAQNLTLRREVEMLLAKGGVEVTRVETERQSLEEIFFSTVEPGGRQ